MMIGMAIALAAGGATTPARDTKPPCAKDVKASAVAQRLSDLPEDITRDLLAWIKGLGDRETPLLQTDAPSAVARTFATGRFAQAMMLGRIWFVQIEVSETSGVRTIGYVWSNDDRKYHRSPMHSFGGPMCATLKAAEAGVISYGAAGF